MKNSSSRNSSKVILSLLSQVSSLLMSPLIFGKGTASSIILLIFSCLSYLILTGVSVKKRSHILPMFHISSFSGPS